MEQIGYSLIDAQGNELQAWGDTAGQCAGVPDVIALPNGDRVHCPALGPLQDWHLVPRMLQTGSTSIAFDGSQVVVTRPAVVVPPKLSNAGLVRFTGVAPIEVLENINLGSASRLTKGRYRVTFDEPCDGGSYTVFVSVEDAAVRIPRVTAKTAAYLEIKVTDNAAAAQDAAVISVKVERVM